MNFLKLISVIVFLFTLNTPAYAGGIPIPVSISTEEELHLIMEIKFPDGDTRYLGYKTTGTYLYSTFGMWISNDGYIVMSEPDSSKYKTLSSTDLDLMKSVELLPKNLPDKPSMSLLVILKGFSMLLIFLSLIAIALFWNGMYVIEKPKNDKVYSSKKNKK